MNCWLVLYLAGAAVLGACKPKEVPYQPPPKDDAGARPIDAPPPPDAPQSSAATTATKIVVGDHSSCALMTDETVRCWGRNSDGQLGNGTTTDSAMPVTVNLRGVKDIVMGTAHVCALLDDESVTCWGRIYYGKKENLLSPSAAPGVAKAKRLFAVRTASCATLADHSLVCWGDIDPKGHLRLSGGSMNRVPTPSNGLDHVAAISTNGALAEDGSAWFWGSDGAPVKTAMTDVIEIASTGDHICGLRRDGSVACAGPTPLCAAAAKLAPAAPPAKPAAKPTAKSAKKAPAKKTAKGKLATKAAVKPAAKSEAPRGMSFEVLRLPPAKHLAFDVGVCVVTKTGKLQCLAPSDGCKVDTPWPGLASVDYVIGNCARMTDGTARCWSVDTKSRLVTAIAGVAGALALAAGSSHACALLGDRSAVCWGSNKFGALGRGKPDEQTHREAAPVTF